MGPKVFVVYLFALMVPTLTTSFSLHLVVDEYGEGFPAAWCLSNHEDFTTMCTFFREVKKNCAGSITSKWFMSDIAPQYYNAWVGVMNDVSRPQKLLCTWHVDRDKE